LGEIEELERKKKEHDDWIANEHVKLQLEHQRSQLLLIQQREDEDRRRAEESERDFKENGGESATRINELEELQLQRDRKCRINEDRKREEEIKRHVEERNAAATKSRAILIKTMKLNLKGYGKVR
jgi:hypothetical protein